LARFSSAFNFRVAAFNFRVEKAVKKDAGTTTTEVRNFTFSL
jgi:hypothetical protein